MINKTKIRYEDLSDADLYDDDIFIDDIPDDEISEDDIIDDDILEVDISKHWQETSIEIFPGEIVNAMVNDMIPNFAITISPEKNEYVLHYKGLPIDLKYLSLEEAQDVAGTITALIMVKQDKKKLWKMYHKYYNSKSCKMAYLVKLAGELA